MGLWDEVRRQIRRVVVESAGSGEGPVPARDARAAAEPDPGTLISADEMEAATENRPIGEGDRKSGGQEVDVRFFRVCEWMLTGGDELLVNFIRFRDQDAVTLWDSRDWTDQKPLPRLGEQAWSYVTKDHKGTTELRVSAKQAMYYRGRRLVGPTPWSSTSTSARTPISWTGGSTPLREARSASPPGPRPRSAGTA